MDIKVNMSDANKCDEPICVGGGCFEGEECPGSDDEEELHHCGICYWLTRDDKILVCDKCGLKACNHCWQHGYILLGGCDECEYDTGWESLCYEYFMSIEALWCPNNDCECDQKPEKKTRDWNALQKYLRENPDGT